MACHFRFEVIAPQGLIGLEPALAQADLGLSVYHSHFNHKNILRGGNALIALDMQTSTTDVMDGSGWLACDRETATALMRRLNAVFASAGYRHTIWTDNEAGDAAVRIRNPEPDGAQGGG